MPKTKINKALEIANTIHQGQVDLIGEPYILHPIRVAFGIMQESTDINEIVVAILHDVLEDEKAPTIGTLKEEFSEEVIEALLAISRLSHESYSDYIEKVSRNKIATKVKIYDILDNMDPMRIAALQEPTTKISKRLKKYAKALKFLIKKGDLV